MPDTALQRSPSDEHEKGRKGIQENNMPVLTPTMAEACESNESSLFRSSQLRFIPTGPRHACALPWLPQQGGGTLTALLTQVALAAPLCSPLGGRPCG